MEWTKNYVISKIPRKFTAVGDPPVQKVATATNGATFQINDAKLYVPVVTLSVNDKIKFLEKIKQGFKGTSSWKKYRSEITTRPKNNNLNYLIDPTVRNINRLFALTFKNGDNDLTRYFFEGCYMLLVEFKDFNGLIDNKSFLICQ